MALVCIAAVGASACSASTGLADFARDGSCERRSARSVVATVGASNSCVGLRWICTRSSSRTMGREALLRLRLHRDEVRALFNDDGIRRISGVQTSLLPASGEQRWLMFRQFAELYPWRGFCARGARLAEPNGPEGLKHRAFVVDRLLIVGAEPTGLWAAWIEGLSANDRRRRLLPNTPFDRQVETPRRDHADVQLWDCDLARRPQAERVTVMPARRSGF